MSIFKNQRIYNFEVNLKIINRNIYKKRIYTKQKNENNIHFFVFSTIKVYHLLITNGKSNFAIDLGPEILNAFLKF